MESGAELIGVNHRDLRTFEVDLGLTERLRKLIPSDVVVVAESGIHGRERRAPDARGGRRRDPGGRGAHAARGPGAAHQGADRHGPGEDLRHLRRRRGAAAAVEAGADLHRLPLLLVRSGASRLRRRRRSSTACRSRPPIVGVFIDQEADEVRQIAEFVGLDLLQLHGSEPPGFDAGRPVMKVLKVKDGHVPDAEGWPDPMMLDSWSADQRGGTGRTWDWELRASPARGTQGVHRRRS